MSVGNVNRTEDDDRLRLARCDRRQTQPRRRSAVYPSGVWRDGQWRLEIQRALNTGHDDDVVFKPGQRVPFALAVFNNVPEYRKQDHGKATDLLWLWLRED